MFIAEIKHRKIHFFLGVLAVAAAVTVWLTSSDSLAEFDSNTESQLVELD